MATPHSRKDEMRTYVLYDERATLGDTESASVLEACEDLRDARASSGGWGTGCCYSYGHGPNKTLVDERFEFCWGGR